MNEFAGVIGPSMSHGRVWLLARIAIASGSLESVAEERASFTIRSAQAISEPLPPVEQVPEVVPAPDPDDVHANVFH